MKLINKVPHNKLFWGSLVSLVYLVVAITTHNGYIQDYWYYFMIAGFIGTFTITSFSNKNLKNTIKLVLLFALVLTAYVVIFVLAKNFTTEGYFSFENSIDWINIYAYFGMGTVGGLMIKWIKTSLLRLSKSRN